jgi:hypothetical protein
VCARSKLPKFDKLWADCTHEESRLADQQKRLIVDEEEAFTTQKNKRSSFRKNNKEANSVRVPECNVPDLASLGNTANVCVGSKVYSI